MPTFEFEDMYYGQTVTGVDEAGLGPLAGPLVVAACIINNRSSKTLSLVNDSKQLSKRKRELMYNMIINNDDFLVSTAIIQNSEINNIGLGKAWRHGVVTAINNLTSNVDICLLDGNKTVDISNTTVIPIIKGDQRSFSIATASIVAKVTRDRIMQKIHDEYPEYGFDTNVGYGTAKHIAALQKLGPTKYHRLSFAKVNNR